MQSMEACAIDMPGSVSPVAIRELGISLGELRKIYWSCVKTRKSIAWWYIGALGTKKSKSFLCTKHPDRYDARLGLN